MVFNRRHKTILFITLVTTGCALLSGAELKEALGFMMLGGALAWAIGSDAASKFYSGLKAAPGRIYPWIRPLVIMALSGTLIGAIAVFSRANPVAVIGFSCFLGVFCAPFVALPTKRLWLRIPLILVAGSLFFTFAILLVATIAASFPSEYPAQMSERFGELVAMGLIVFLAGIFWLSKGWKLIIKGMSAQAPAEVSNASQVKRHSWPQYMSVFLGIGVLALLLCLLSWSASGDWAYAPEKTPDQKNNNLFMQVGFVILLAWWPYSSWKTILERQPNSEPRYLKWHKGVTAFIGMSMAVLLGLAITLGVQNGNDRIMTDQITSIMKDFGAIAAKIGAIKQRNMQTTGDYIQAFSEVEALLPEFEAQLNRYKQVLQQMKQRDVTRGLINTQKFYKTHRPEFQRNLQEQADVIEAIVSVTEKEVETAKAMNALPVRYQPDFWKENFRPLLIKEGTLREKALALDAEQKSLKN